LNPNVALRDFSFTPIGYPALGIGFLSTKKQIWAPKFFMRRILETAEALLSTLSGERRKMDVI
jgi:hypothetical protein